jgi:hypothetical protein
MTPRLHHRSGAGRRAHAASAHLVTAGLAVFLVGGILNALLAARILSSSDYTIYAAYISLLGIVVLGPAGSLEQESALRFSRPSGSTRKMLAKMLVRAGVICLVVAVLLVAPVGGWQHRLLGASTVFGVACLVTGAPVVAVAAIGRGFLTVHRSYTAVGIVNAAIGVAMLILPPTLHEVGVGWLSAFLSGASLAWLPALVIVLLRVRPAARRAAMLPPYEGTAYSSGMTAWLLAANLLMIASLLAVPVVLRWHVEGLGAAPVAAAQLLVSLSRLAPTVVLGLLPLVVSQLSTGQGPERRRVAVRWFALATAMGGGAVIGLAIVGTRVVSWITGSSSGLSPGVAVVATLPALTLCPAVVAMALAMTRKNWSVVVAAWALSLAALVAVAAIDAGSDLLLVVGGVALAGALPLVVLAVGLRFGSLTRQVGLHE